MPVLWAGAAITPLLFSCMALSRPAYWVFPPVIRHSSFHCRLSLFTLSCSSFQFLPVSTAFCTLRTAVSPAISGADATVSTMPPIVLEVRRAARCQSGRASKSAMYCRASWICLRL